MSKYYSKLVYCLPIALVLVLLVVTQLAHHHWDLAWDRLAIEQGSYWRIISGQFVHNNTAHLVLNAVASLLVYVLMRELVSGIQFIIHVFFIALLTGLALYLFEPVLDYYLGFSAVLHGLVAAYAVIKLPQDKYFGGLIVILLWVKLGFAESPETADLIGIRVATEAHLWGVVSGVVSGFLQAQICKRCQ
ncbi:MAG: rhomboid family GlyGly-CTERM serine protease [Zhongshania sp.]